MKLLVCYIILFVFISCTTQSPNQIEGFKKLDEIDASTNSEYIKQHLNQRVKWYKWNKHNLNAIKNLNRPIFLHIGYFGCHWCSKMSEEHFNQVDTAQILNNNYISIIVDKDELPKVNKLYLNYQMTLMGQQGWPINMWLTQDLLPYYASSYIPRTPRGGLELSFNQLLKVFLDKFKNGHEKVKSFANKIKRVSEEKENVPTKRELDQNYGGIKKTSKFLTDYDIVESQKEAYIQNDNDLFEHNKKTIEHILKSAIYDKKNGGVHRYSVTEDWETPHFEKTLEDNSLFLLALANQYYLTKNKLYLDFGELSIRFFKTYLKMKNNLYSSLISADSMTQNGDKEGRYYLYRPKRSYLSCFKEYRKTKLYMTSINDLKPSTLEKCRKYYKSIDPIIKTIPLHDKRAKLSNMITFVNSLLKFGIRTNTNNYVQDALDIYLVIIKKFLSENKIYENCSINQCYGKASLEEISKLLKLSFDFLTLNNQEIYISNINKILFLKRKMYPNITDKYISDIKATLNLLYDKDYEDAMLKKMSYFAVIVGEDQSLKNKIKGTLFPYSAIVYKNTSNQFKSFIEPKKKYKNKTTIYICNNKSCYRPVTNFTEFYSQSQKIFKQERKI